MRLDGNIFGYIVLLIIGISIGILIGFVYSIFKSRSMKAEANKKFRSLTASFEKEKNTSESILRELEVGILAYVDGRLVTANPSAKMLLGVKNIPATFPVFLREFGQDNGIQAAVVLQTTDITGHIAFPERVVHVRLTPARFLGGRSASWIIILQDITEQEREEKQRKEFVANVSHELKTPLTTISAYSETLLDWGLDGKSAKEVRDDISRIHDDAVRMDALVQNLLLLSAIDSRGIKPKMVQYDVVSVMRQVINRMQHQATEENVLLESSVLSLIPPVFGDPNALDRIITNLASNGIKYTDVKGYVSVSVQLINDYISLKFADNGMGVSKENLQRLFDRFFRVDATGSRKYGGTGLGLSIAKELVEIQGGTISVSSKLGIGTEFVVTIPKAEKTYRDVIMSLRDDVPRKEILYENAMTYLLNTSEELNIPVRDLRELTPAQEKEIFQYLLEIPSENGTPDYQIVPPSESLQARFEEQGNTTDKNQQERVRTREAMGSPKKASPKGQEQKSVSGK